MEPELVSRFHLTNKMSIYSDISKQIGWENQSVSTPTITRVEELEKMALAGDEAAFEALFRLNRFFSASNEHEVTISNRIYDAFGKSQGVFQK